MKCSTCTAAVCVVLGFLFAAIGIATPGWFVMNIDVSQAVKKAESDASGWLSNSGYDYGTTPRFGMTGNLPNQFTVSVSLSIFYVRGCVKELMCMTGSMDDISSMYHQYSKNVGNDMMADGMSDLVMTQAESSIALILAFIGLILTVCYIRMLKNNHKACGIAAFFFLGIGGVILCVVIGQYGQVYAQLLNLKDTISSLSDSLSSLDIGLPYSLIISGIGAFFLFVAALSVIISVCTQRNEHTGQVLSSVQMRPPVHMSNIVGSNQGYTILQEPSVSVAIQ